MEQGTAPPRILTLTLDPLAQAAFDTLRRAHFPPDRLVVGAHVTLFHALPAKLSTEVIEAQAATTGPFAVQVDSVRFLGRGVAYALRSDRLSRLRERLAHHWRGCLTAQDRQPWRPHVTIQNKVAPGIARALHDTLAVSFSRYEVTATGFDLWIYRGGPWEAQKTFAFEG